MFFLFSLLDREVAAGLASYFCHFLDVCTPPIASQYSLFTVHTTLSSPKSSFSHSPRECVLDRETSPSIIRVLDRFFFGHPLLTCAAVSTFATTCCWNHRVLIRFDSGKIEALCKVSDALKKGEGTRNVYVDGCVYMLQAQLAEEKARRRNKDDGGQSAPGTELSMNNGFVSPGGMYTNQPLMKTYVRVGSRRRYKRRALRTPYSGNGVLRIKNE
ncbi:hypothetical protein LR48_Vigan04g138500 [Vigna angularis]|uniref:Uncharacterized protein n=1 Tax=Phaseolus angularis TaxID=3914 RepID=A0A0L9UF46_PHAAN|nr:hypothetical protein LR48_Vigan04g138500 [Vigna angularis]